jgi:hypothetical protein
VTPLISGCHPKMIGQKVPRLYVLLSALWTPVRNPDQAPSVEPTGS